jgi:hypothetical protein
MESRILETLNITPEQLKLYLDKKQKIRDQTALRIKKYKVVNAEKLKAKLEKSKQEKAQKRRELEAPKIEKNEVVKIPRKYIKKAPIVKDDNYVETRGRKRKTPKIETIKNDNIIKIKRGPKIRDLNILDLVDFLK